MDYCWVVAIEIIAAGYLKRWKWSDFLFCWFRFFFFFNWMRIGYARLCLALTWICGTDLLTGIVSCRELSCT